MNEAEIVIEQEHVEKVFNDSLEDHCGRKEQEQCH